MVYPFTATDFSNLNIIQNGDVIEYSLELLNSGDISFNTDISLNFTLVGGGGGGGGGGHNNGTGSPAYPSGGGGGGGAAGTYQIYLSAYDSHNYSVGTGGTAGKANLSGASGESSFIDFSGNNTADSVFANGGSPGNGHYGGNTSGSFIDSPSITGLGIITIVDSSGGAGGSGVDINNVPGSGTNGSTNNVISYNIDYTNTKYLGSGGGGADASGSAYTVDPSAGNGGGGGNGNTGGIVGAGIDNTPSPNGGTGKNGNVPGAGGGGGGKPGQNSTTDGGYTPKITFGGNGADGAIYIWFNIPIDDYYYSRYQVEISNNFTIIPYNTSFQTVEISGNNVPFLTIDNSSNGEITNNSYPDISSYIFQVSINTNDTNIYENIELDIVAPYYNDTYNFTLGDSITISPSIILQDVSNTELIGLNNSFFQIDLSGNITNSTTNPPPIAQYQLTSYIVFDNGIISQNNININVSLPSEFNLNFMEVGSDISGDIYNTKYSENGIVWYSSIDNPLDTGNNVAYGNIDNSNIWIQVGEDSSKNTIKFTINNGETWNNTIGDFSGYYGSGNDILFGENNGNPIWVAVGADGNQTAQTNRETIKYSTDGITWNNVTNSFNTTTGGNGVTWNRNFQGNNLWVVVGEGEIQGTITNSNIKYSTDGITWVDTFDYPTNFIGNAVGYGNGWIPGQHKWSAWIPQTTWVALGKQSGNNILYSYNGINWTSANDSFPNGGNGIVWGVDSSGNYMWVAVGSDENGTSKTIKYSTDGINWNNANNAFTGGSNSIANDVAWGIDISGRYLWIAGGKDNNGELTTKYSYDAINWQDTYQNTIEGEVNGIGSKYYPPNPPSPPSAESIPQILMSGGPIRRCGTKYQRCYNYSKQIPGSSGNVVITGGSRAQLVSEMSGFGKIFGKFVQRDAPTYGYGSRAGAPYGYGKSPKNDLNY